MSLSFLPTTKPKIIKPLTYQYLLIMWFCFCHYANAQQKSFIIPDSLSTKDYEYYNNNIRYEEQNTSTELLYAQSWLAKAKREKNYGQMVSAYKALMYKNDEKLELKYIDSMLTVAKKSTEIELIGSVYLTKGIIYYGRKQHRKAMDYFLIADEYISKTNNRYLIYKTKYSIAEIKYYLGFYDEAIALFKDCVSYFKDVNDLAYLNSLHSLGLSYNRNGKYNLCSQMNQIGFSEGLRLKNLDMQYYFIQSEGINQYFKHNYSDAINKLQKALPVLKSKKDYTNQTLAYFYIGKSYNSQKLQEKALHYFKKVDEAFKNQNYIRPDLREAYELLIDYYQQQNNKELELYYVSTLLKVDKFLNQDYRYLSDKVRKEYDTKKLLQIQKDSTTSTKYKTVGGLIIIMIMAIIIALFTGRHFKNKKRFKELLNPKPDVNQSFVQNNKSKEIVLDINPDVVNEILQNIEKFELKRRYLERDMTLVKMASILNTNTKYVSKIILKYRNKGTIEYVSDLKIDHIVELLKNEKKYRQYTNKALGEEAGFGTTQNFTKAFNVRTGLSPTYFIRELNKTI